MVGGLLEKVLVAGLFLSAKVEWSELRICLPAYLLDSTDRARTKAVIVLCIPQCSLLQLPMLGVRYLLRVLLLSS